MQMIPSLVPVAASPLTGIIPDHVWLVSIHLDCGHNHLTTMTTVMGNHAGLWWCSPCGTGNHIERIYR